MSRSYMSVRLSYDAKYCIDVIQASIQHELDKNINETDLSYIEKKINDYLENKNDILGGVSISTLFKVTVSSVIEKAFYYSKDFTVEQWEAVRVSYIENSDEIPKDKNVGNLALRLYLDDEIISRFERYQKDFMLEDMVRIARMSYVIKLVVYAYFKQLNSKGNDSVF